MINKKITEKIIIKTLNILLLFFLFYGINMITSYVMHYYHEGTHETICLQNGGNIIEKQVSYREGKTVCSIVNDNILKGYMLTDIIGYHIIGFKIVMEILLFIVLGFIILNRK